MVTKKNSGARNLHRLVSAVAFIANLLQNVVKDRQVTLRQVGRSPRRSSGLVCSARCMRHGRGACMARDCPVARSLHALSFFLGIP